MAKIEGVFDDYSRHNYKGSFMFRADQTMNPFTWKAPIYWEGYINNDEVKFIQINDTAFSDDFDWTGFPEKYNNVKPYIREAIDIEMKSMD